jgi:hypothetical protein
MITETRKLSDSEAAAIEAQVGYLIMVIEPSKAHRLPAAIALATDLAQKTGRPVGVFKLSALVEPEKVSSVKAVALPSATVVKQARDAMAGVKS